MTYRQFYWSLRQSGYIVNDDPNRKYATIRVPGIKHNTRFKTLGEGYTPSAITQRILSNIRPEIPPKKQTQTQGHESRHFTLRGSLLSRRKITGLYARYLHYCYLLGCYPKQREKQQKPLSPEVREAVRQIHKYSAEARLLCRNRIETTEQLYAFIDGRKKDLGDFEHQRGRVYNRMKSAKMPETVDYLKLERDELSDIIKTIRQELFHARDILARSADIERQIRSEMKMRADRSKSEKHKNKERGKER